MGLRRSDPWRHLAVRACVAATAGGSS